MCQVIFGCNGSYHLERGILLNAFETVRGVRFLDIIPEKMSEIAKELKKSNDIQRERNCILKEQNAILKKVFEDNNVIT